jgi:hypothetical protein
MRGVTPPLPQYAFMAWCSVTAYGDKKERNESESERKKTK